MSRLIVRPATHADVAELSERIHGVAERLVYTSFAYAGEIDGKVVGFGGLSYVNGDVVAFADLMDVVREHPVTLHRIALKVLEEAARRGHRAVYASADKLTPAAARWLVRLGFVKQEDRNLYKWTCAVRP